MILISSRSVMNLLYLSGRERIVQLFLIRVLFVIFEPAVGIHVKALKGERNLRYIYVLTASSSQPG